MRSTSLLPALALATVVLAGCSAGPAAAPGSAPQTAPSAPALTPSSKPSSPAITAGGSPSASRPAVAGSGVAGRTVIRGGCPVYSDASPCPDRQISARITVTVHGAPLVVAVVSTDAQGHFRIPLRPGSYVLHAVSLTGGPRARSAPVDVLVRSNRYTAVTVPFASVFEMGGGPPGVGS